MKTLKIGAVLAVVLLGLNGVAQAGRQVKGCDWFPDTLETPAIKQFCDNHDRAYEVHNCTARSWLPMSGQAHECQIANRNVRNGIAFELMKETGKGMVRSAALRTMPLFVH